MDVSAFTYLLVANAIVFYRFFYFTLLSIISLLFLYDATVQSAILSGKQESSKLQDLLLLDVIPLSLG